MTMNASALFTQAKDYALVVAGSIILAFAYSAFITPYEIVPGGVYGITIVLHHITRGLFDFCPDGLPVGAMALVFNIPFMILADKYIGLQSGGKTITAFVLISVFTDLFASLLGNKALVEQEAILNAFYGGALMGVGVSLIFRGHGTCAGTDVVATLLSMKTHIKVSTLIMIIDSCVVLLGLLAFGDLRVPLYSWLTIFIYGKALNMLQGDNPYKTVFIVTSHPDEVKAILLGDLNIGGNLLKGTGLYSGENRDIILALVKRGKIYKLREAVYAAVNNVFFMVMDSTRESFWLSPSQGMVKHE